MLARLAKEKALSANMLMKKQIEEKCQEEKICNIALLSRHHQKQRTPPSNARRKKETMCKQHSGPTIQYEVQ